MGQLGDVSRSPAGLPFVVASKAQEVSGFIGEPGWDRTSDPVIKSHVLYRLSYGLERVDNAPSYVGFAGFAQVASDRDYGSSIPLIEHGEGGCRRDHPSVKLKS